MNLKKLLAGLLFIVFALLLVFYFKGSLKMVSIMTTISSFCRWTEQSLPFAYADFTYQEGGRVFRAQTTETDCENIKEFVGSHRFGERIELIKEDENVVKIRRENGDIYRVGVYEIISQTVESGLLNGPHELWEYPYIDFLGWDNPVPKKVISECLSITDDGLHDRCLSFQVALLRDAGICGQMRSEKNQALCKQWVIDIRNGKFD